MSAGLRQATDELAAAAIALDDLLPVVNPKWLHGQIGDRIVAAQASAGLTKARAERALAG